MKEYKNQIDQLFREKLSQKKVTPSTDAWQKLNGELSQNRKKKSTVYWYVAASFVVLIGFGILFINLNTDHISGDRLSQNKKVAVKDEETNPVKNKIRMESISPSPEKNGSKILEDQQSGSGEEENISSEVNHTARLSPENLGKKMVKEVEKKDDMLQAVPLADPVQQPEISEMPEEVATNETPVNQKEKINTESEAENEDLLAANTQQEQEEYFDEVKIIYKKSDTQTEKKKTFKKIVNLARDITEGEYGIGDLREAKNELLAFGKRKDKND